MPTLASITPADGAHEVWGNSPVVANITHGVGLDPALVEIVVNGVSCTVANGLLEYWGHQDISGGAIVDDFTDVYFGTVALWRDASLQETTIQVIYDAAPLTTITVYTTESEIDPNGATGYYLTLGVEADWLLGAVDGVYNVIDPAVELAEQQVYYYVEPPPDGVFDAYYMVGTWITSDGVASGVTGERHITDGPAAAIIYGYVQQDGPAAALVQGWMLTDGSAAGIPAVRHWHDGASAGIAGVQTTTDGSAAGIVYGVNRRTHIEIRSITPETAAMLATLGVTRV